MQRKLNPQYMCSGKTRYVGELQARHVARRRENRQAYFCPFCHFWHVGGATASHRAFTRQKARERHNAGIASVRKLLEDD